METLFSTRGKPHTIEIEYDYRQRAYGVYYDGKLYCFEDTHAEALADRLYLIKSKKLSFEPKKGARA